LKTQFDVTLDKRKIHLDQPIKTLGEHEVELQLHPQVKGSLKVRVESSTPITPPAETAAPSEAKKDEVRTEKRGRRPSAEKAEAAAAAGKVERSSRPSKAPRAPKPSKGEKPAKSDKSG
jgi:large subunit ribosomal protein L9